MSTDVIMPKLGFSMEEGAVVEWLVPDGGVVASGEPLFSLETEKSVLEIEAPASGVLRISSLLGEVYPIGTCLAVIE